MGTAAWCDEQECPICGCPSFDLDDYSYDELEPWMEVRCKMCDAYYDVEVVAVIDFYLAQLAPGMLLGREVDTHLAMRWRGLIERLHSLGRAEV